MHYLPVWLVDWVVPEQWKPLLRRWRYWPQPILWLFPQHCWCSSGYELYKYPRKEQVRLYYYKGPWVALPFLILIHIIRINLISTDIPQKCSKLFFFSMESFELHFGLVLDGKSMNQKAKPHKRSLVVGEQNGIRVLGLCRFVSKELTL